MSNGTASGNGGRGDSLCLTRREIKAAWNAAVTAKDFEGLARRLIEAADLSRLRGGVRDAIRFERMAYAARNFGTIIGARIHEEAGRIKDGLGDRLEGIAQSYAREVEPVLRASKAEREHAEGCDAGLREVMDLISRQEGDLKTLQRNLADSRLRLSGLWAERDEALAALAMLREEFSVLEQGAEASSRVALSEAEELEREVVLRTVDELGRLRQEIWDAAWVGGREPLVNLAGRTDGWFADDGHAGHVVAG